MPATAAAVLEAFGDSAIWFAGGDDHARYRSWLRILAGDVDVVVGTRPAVFAPLQRPRPDLDLARGASGAPGGPRALLPRARDRRGAGPARGRRVRPVLAQSLGRDRGGGEARGRSATLRPPRTAERAAAPLVETAAPGAEDRSPRLTRCSGSATHGCDRRVAGRLRRGARVPLVRPAARGARSAAVRSARRAARCRACAAGPPGRCSVCSGTSFGIERGGVERIAEWAARIAPSASVEVGTAASVKDVGPRRLDLVALLDPDRALARPGFHAGEQALATWMEAAAWAGPRSRGGRVLAHTRTPGDPALQALVRWEPVPVPPGGGRAPSRGGLRARTRGVPGDRARVLRTNSRRRWTRQGRVPC